MLVFNFLMKKYHFKNRLVDLENKEIRISEINNFLRQAEIEHDAAVCFMDMDFTLKYVSPAHDVLYGKKELNVSNADNAHPDDVRDYAFDVLKELKDNKVCLFIFRYKMADGEFKKVKSKVFPVADENGVVHAVFTVSDLAAENEYLGISILD